jgi:hypothetical protein
MKPFRKKHKISSLGEETISREFLSMLGRSETKTVRHQKVYTSENQEHKGSTPFAYSCPPKTATPPKYVTWLGSPCRETEVSHRLQALLKQDNTDGSSTTVAELCCT